MRPGTDACNWSLTKGWAGIAKTRPMMGVSCPTMGLSDPTWGIGLGKIAHPRADHHHGAHPPPRTPHMCQDGGSE